MLNFIWAHMQFICISKLPSYKMLKVNKLNSSDQKGMQTQIIQEWSHVCTISTEYKMSWERDPSVFWVMLH